MSRGGACIYYRLKVFFLFHSEMTLFNHFFKLFIKTTYITDHLRHYMIERSSNTHCQQSKLIVVCCRIHFLQNVSQIRIKGL